MTVTVTGLTAEKMLELSDANIISGDVISGSLLLMTRGGDTIDAGLVIGPEGPTGSGYTICTSSDRPLSPFVGLVIYETDTGLVRVWDGDKWRAQERFICTSTTRPEPFTADEGMLIYETDTNTEYIWDGSAWQFYQRLTIVCTSGTRPSTPLVGTKIYETDTGKTLQYYSVGKGWQPGDWAVGWGQVAYVLSDTNHAAVTAIQNVSGMSAQWIACADRYYKTTMTMPRNQNNASGVGEVQAFLCDGSNAVVELAWAKAVGISEVFSISTSKMEGGIPNGNVTRKMRALSSVAGGVKFNGSSYRGNVMVEDVGPSGAP